MGWQDPAVVNLDIDSGDDVWCGLDGGLDHNVREVFQLVYKLAEIHSVRGWELVLARNVRRIELDVGSSSVVDIAVG